MPDGQLRVDTGHVPASGMAIRGTRVRGRDKGSKTARKTLSLLGAIRLCGSVYHIRRKIKLYTVLDDIFYFFPDRFRINVGPWTSMGLMAH